MPDLQPGLLAQLTSMLHECRHYLRLFSALWEWVALVDSPSMYGIFIGSIKRRSFQRVLHHNWFSASGLVAIFLGAENGIVGRQGIVNRRRVNLIANRF